MAGTRKSRIRKTAPTIRERAEVAQIKAETVAPKRLRRLIVASARPLTKVRLPKNRAGNGIGSVVRFVLKALSWLVPRYFKNSWREVRQVTWPSRKETWRLTGAVFVFAIVFGALVAAVDKGLDEVFKKLVLK